MTTERIVVADAGPIIHLDELGALDLLSDLGTVHVPSAVWQEVVLHRPEFVSTPSWLTVHTEELPVVGKVQVLARIMGLHRGEIAALRLCHAVSASLFLCDDSAARLAADSLGIQVHGTLGILLRSLRRGLRSKDQVLEALHSVPALSTLHVRRSLLREIIQEVEDYPKLS